VAALTVLLILTLLALGTPPAVPERPTPARSVPDPVPPDGGRGPKGSGDTLPAAPSPAAGKKYALLVGVRDYSDARLSELAFTENDVEQLDRILSANGFQSEVLTTTRGEADAARRPTAANIRGRLKGILARANKQDLVLVALAGHGLRTRVESAGKARDESFFCPADARPGQGRDLAELGQTLLGFTELFAALGDSGAGVKLLLIDACRHDPEAGRNVDLDTLPYPPRGTAALFSCKSGERAFETPKVGHGVFFHFVLEGLRGKARNDEGEVTWLSLAGYVTRQVAREVSGLIGPGARQTPHLVANQEGESPVLLAAATPPPADSLFRLGVAACLGLGRKVDWAEGVAYLRRAAEKGHAPAQALLALCLATGTGVARDAAEAQRWGSRSAAGVRSAADGGDPRAQWLLGGMCADGRGVDKNEAAAVRWYRQAAGQQWAAAKNDLGDLAAAGRGLAKDEGEAVRWYRQAADQKLAVAQRNLGLMYAGGRGVAKDDAEAEKWLLLAAEQGEPVAAEQLGLLYAEGRVKRSEAEMEKWLTLAAEHGSAPCQRQLALLWAHGVGVPRNDREAARWCHKAAEQGDDVAQNQFGELCAAGRGTERDAQEAGRWFRLAAGQGNRDGQVNFGDWWAAGLGGEADRTQAAYWYWKARLGRHPIADTRWRELFHLVDTCPLEPINPIGRPNRCLANCAACHAQIPGR
jgi:TPR repeat protein